MSNKPVSPALPLLRLPDAEARFLALSRAPEITCLGGAFAQSSEHELRTLFSIAVTSLRQVAGEVADGTASPTPNPRIPSRVASDARFTPVATKARLEEMAAMIDHQKEQIRRLTTELEEVRKER